MAYTQEENNEFLAQSTAPFQSSGNNLEDLLDLIAIALIQSPLVNTSDVENNQKFIRDGQLQSGQGEGVLGVLALFQKDIKANQEDLNSFDSTGGEFLQGLADSITDFNTLVVSINAGVNYEVSISISGGGLSGSFDITQYLVQDGTFSNVSQFIPLQQSSSIVDVDKAEEFLDTNIFELLPASDTRQSRIIRFFQELNALLPPNTPEFDLDNDNRVDREEGTNNWIGATQYSKDNSISYAQENTDGNINEEDAFIHRLKDTANDINSSRTIEDIYNTIFPYLTDILESQDGIDDTRPEYENQSSGYLQFRSPNQGIIIRNTNQEFIEGLDPNNPTYLETGFTITMWVRFLDKVSTGTLFNYGNPTRAENPFGFKLDTFMSEDGQKRHLRLLVYDDTSGFGANPYTNRHWYDSHIGVIVDDLPFPKLLSTLNNLEGLEQINLDQYLEVPIDFNEWYFICATYNPNIDERGSEQGIFIPEYWNNHMIDDGSGNPTYQYTSNSGVGNRSKVEIISRTDLLRARGFRV